MEFNTTHPAAESPFVFSSTIYTGSHSGAADTPLLLSSSTAPHSSPFTRSNVAGAIIILLSVYLSAVRYLRYQHLNNIQQKYGWTTTEFSNIDYKDAQTILGSLFLLDSPWIFRQAKDFAFLRVRTPLFPCVVRPRVTWHSSRHSAFHLFLPCPSRQRRWLTNPASAIQTPLCLLQSGS